MTGHPEGWRKSTRSQQQTSCVELDRVGDGAAVRDAKDRSTGYFTTDRARWSAFVDAVKTDRFA